MSEVHPSEREFDLALVDAESESFREHVRSCEACISHLASLRWEQDSFRAGEEPRRAARIIVDKVAQRGWRARLLRWAWLPTVGTAAAALIFFVHGKPPEVRAKGGPRVTVYVRSDGRPKLWDGSPLHDGDAIQLQVQDAPGVTGSRVTVFDVDAQCAVARERALPLHGPTVLPLGWTLRGEEGGERLYVAFGRDAAEEELAQALRDAGACRSGLAPDVSSPGFVARGVLLRPRRTP